MNLKKFISGVSALTIAASAFAGMAVTANAATVTTTKYGQIIGIDFDSETTPFANTVDLSSATIDGYTYNSGDGNFPDTDTSHITTAETTFNNNNKTTGAGHYIVTNTTQDVTIPAGLRVDATKDKVNFKFKYVFGNLSGKLAGFFIKDEDGTNLVAYYSSRYSGISTSGTVNTLGLTSVLAGSLTSNGATWADPVDFDITLDYATKDITAVIEGTTYSAVLPTGAKAPATFEVKSNYNNSARYSLFDDLEITNIEGTAVALYDYTLAYQCNGVTVKTESGSKVDGTEINAESARFMGDGDYASKYYFVDDSTTSFTVTASGTNNFVVNVREADSFTGTVNAVVSGINDPIKTYQKSGVEGDTVTVYYDKYIKYNGKYYTTTANGSEPYYGIKFTADVNQDITYTELDADYAVEGEDISGVARDSSNIQGRFAGGYGGRIQYSPITLDWSPEVDSNVTVSVNAYERSSSSSSTGITLPIYTVDANGNTTDTGETLSWGRMSTGDRTATINVPAGSKIMLYWSETYRTNLYVDYASIKVNSAAAYGTADVTPVTTETEADGDAAKAYTFTATPAKTDGTFNVINSVTVTVSVDGLEDKTATKYAADFGEISGPTLFGIVITGDVTPSAINVTVD